MVSVACVSNAAHARGVVRADCHDAHPGYLNFGAKEGTAAKNHGKCLNTRFSRLPAMAGQSMTSRIVRQLRITHLLATAGIAAFLLLLVGSATVKNLFVCMVFILFCIAVRFYKRVLANLPIEVELVTFTIVALAVTLGFWYALFAGILGFLASEFFNNHLNKYIPLTIGFYAIMAFVASVLPGNIVAVGVTTTIINNAGQLVLYQVIGGFSTIENVLYSITNISFNLFIFFKIAPAIVALLA